MTPRIGIHNTPRRLYTLLSSPIIVQASLLQPPADTTLISICSSHPRIRDPTFRLHSYPARPLCLWDNHTATKHNLINIGRRQVDSNTGRPPEAQRADSQLQCVTNEVEQAIQERTLTKRCLQGVRTKMFAFFKTCKVVQQRLRLHRA